MPELDRGDGVEIHWGQRGDGPAVMLAPYWSGHPSAFEKLGTELAADHRVITYDARGTGRSTRTGPHDMETGAADLAAVAEAAGGETVVISLADACNRAVRVAEQRPELVRAVVAPGAAPVGRDALRKSDALVASDNVLGAFIDMLSTSYRGALRALLPSTNPQMSPDEVDARIDLQEQYCPRETAVARCEAWINDDPLEAGKRVGGRLWLVYSENMAGPWFPSGAAFVETFKRMLPDANFVPMADGIVSRPDLTAEVVREITSKQS